MLRLGLLATETSQVGGNPLDAALGEATPTPSPGYHRLSLVPFDHQRRMTSALPDGTRLIVTKGAPESVLAQCKMMPPGAQATLQAQFAAGGRVVAVARPAPGCSTIAPSDEHDLTLTGFLVFLDQPKADAADALRRLAELGITVKVATGDNPLVAEKICADLGLRSGGTLTGTEIDAMDDDALASAVETATISPGSRPSRRRG